MDADIQINLTDEQIQLLLQNIDLIRAVAQEIVLDIKRDHYSRDSFYTVLKRELSRELINSELENIKKNLDKKVNFLISRNLSEMIKKNIDKKLESEQ